MSEDPHLFFQMVTYADGKKFKRNGACSLTHAPTRDEVLALIDAKYARGEFVEWLERVTVRGGARVWHYAAFESEIIQTAPAARESKRRTRRALVQMRMEL